METEAVFYTRALRRVYRGMLWIAAATAVLLLALKTWLWALLFLCGAAAAYLGFHWLHDAVEALGPGANPARKRVLFFLVLRYVILGAGGYAIVKVFGVNAIAAVLGLFTPVAAVIAEVLYEIVNDTGT